MRKANDFHKHLSRAKTPEPLASLQRFIKQARKAERESTVGGRIDARTAGEQLFGSMTVNGKKTLHRMALLTDNFIDAANKYFEYDGESW